MKTWITADWHLGEDRFELMGRPFVAQQEHVYELVTRHNALVAPNDLVLVVGDVCYQKAPEFLEHVERFNGKKILVRGNHDRGITDEQFAPYFETIFADGSGFELDAAGVSCYVTHYPTEGRPDLFNLVGHIHSIWKYQLNSFNVGVDANHFFPVNIDRIPFHKAAIEQFYDEDAWAAYSPVNSSYRGLRGKVGTYFRPTNK